MNYLMDFIQEDGSVTTILVDPLKAHEVFEEIKGAYALDSETWDNTRIVSLSFTDDGAPITISAKLYAVLAIPK